MVQYHCVFCNFPDRGLDISLHLENKTIQLLDTQQKQSLESLIYISNMIQIYLEIIIKLILTVFLYFSAFLADVEVTKIICAETQITPS